MLQVEEATPRSPYWSDQYSDDWELTIWGWIPIISSWVMGWLIMLMTLWALDGAKQ